MKKQYIIPEALIVATQTLSLMEGSDKVEGAGADVDAGYEGVDTDGSKDPDAKERDFYTDGLW